MDSSIRAARPAQRLVQSSPVGRPRVKSLCLRRTDEFGPTSIWPGEAQELAGDGHRRQIDNQLENPRLLLSLDNASSTIFALATTGPQGKRGNRNRQGESPRAGTAGG